MSSLGVIFLIETRYLLPLMIACLALAVAALSYGARRNYRLPFALSIVASGLILIGRFVLDAPALTIGATCLLVGAYVWSFWLRRETGASSCRSCVSPAVAAAESTERLTNLDMPLACALSQAQFVERKRLVNCLAEEATERRSLSNGVRLCFEAISGRVTDLAKFVDVERACCPFLTFRIDVQPGEPVWLELTGPAAAQEIIRELIPELVSND